MSALTTFARLCFRLMRRRDCCQVTEEMLAVLTEGEGREEGGGHCQETASSLSQLSIQTVFSMLSHLTQWSRYILYSKHKNGGELAKTKKVNFGRIYIIYTYIYMRISQMLLQKAESTSAWWPS